MQKWAFILLLVLPICSFATHNRAGEITYRQLSDYTFEIKVVTFTNTKPTSTGQVPADRPQLTILWGDNTGAYIDRDEYIDLPGYYRRNTYISSHTYPGPGTYEIVVEDPNRNEGVQNIPNSVNVVFSIRTIMQINPVLGINNTPVLLNPPIDKAAIGQVFIHNPAAFDPDGDSISYKLTPCTGENGDVIDGYTLPPSSNQPIYVNELSGDLIWNAPVTVGIFNVALLIEEWRSGIKIGEIVRDMQIEVYESENTPPSIGLLSDTCIRAGNTLIKNIQVTDQGNETVTLSATGGAFMLTNPAEFPSKTGAVPLNQNFVWATKFHHVRKQPYLVVFKAQDNNSQVNLVDLKNFNIYVVGAPPNSLEVVPTNNSVELSWKPTDTTFASGYCIYRSTQSHEYIPGVCETGIPESLGFEKIKTINGRDTLSFIDNNNGTGLIQGYEYCYRITSFYPDGAESYSSEEICTQLIRGIPVITKVNVLETDSLLGKIELQWLKPLDIDSALTPPPFKYIVYRSNDLWGTSMQLIDTIYDFNDTVFVDMGLNTLKNPYSYKVEFHYSGGLAQLPMVASSVFIKTTGADNRVIIDIEKNVPWRNRSYSVFRKNKATNVFDSVGTTNTTVFEDINLKNADTLIYKVKSVGEYLLDEFPKPLLNFSQEDKGIPVDTVPPTAPVLTVNSFCDSSYNILSWSMLPPNQETTGYLVYYSLELENNLSLIHQIGTGDSMTYFHYPTSSMAGCYRVAAKDSSENISPLSNKVCVDNCEYYALPNVFSPDGDEVNPLFVPVTPHSIIDKFVEKINIKIYSRWGSLVFETDNKHIEWDGRNQQTKKMVADGVYFYVCDVYEKRLSGSEPRYLTGFIYVFTGGEK